MQRALGLFSKNVVSDRISLKDPHGLRYGKGGKAEQHLPYNDLTAAVGMQEAKNPFRIFPGPPGPDGKKP